MGVAKCRAYAKFIFLFRLEGGRLCGWLMYYGAVMFLADYQSVGIPSWT
jgi:hypothetical protein